MYHHSSIVILADLGYHHYPWPATTFLLSLNSLIHVFLYMYYGQAALDSNQKPSWRRYLTMLQILQFVLGLIHCTWGYLYHGFCIYGIMYGITMISLFSNFYYQAFIRKRPEKNKAQWEKKKDWVLVALFSSKLNNSVTWSRDVYIWTGAKSRYFVA